ncbi:MAG TPA: phage tail tube protein [Williamwhitmania sp.]|nr:phage tail tube protein [Williamwhitmania sp.]
MAYYVGRRGSLGAAKEGTRGAATTPALWVTYNSVSFDDKAVVVDSEGAFGQIADTFESYITKKYGEGEFEFDLDDKFIGLILTGIAGAAPSSSAGPTNYIHTYTLANTNQHQSLSLLVQDPNTAKMFRLAMIDKMTITIEPEGLAKCSVGFKSAAGQDWTLVSPVYTALGNKFIHSMLAFKIAAATGDLAAASALNLNRLEFTVTKNVEDFQDLGTATPSDILNKQLQVEGSFEIGFNDNTYRNYMLDGSTKAVEILLTYGTNNSLQIQLPKVRFANWEPNKGLNDIVSEKIEFKGQYDVVNTANVISTLVLANQLGSGTY